MDRTGLPGEDLIAQGLTDLAASRVSLESLLVSIGAPKLRSLGLHVPTSLSDPEHRLYDLLRAREGTAAHARYNALTRRLVSYERALACVK